MDSSTLGHFKRFNSALFASLDTPSDGRKKMTATNMGLFLFRLLLRLTERLPDIRKMINISISETATSPVR